MRKGRKYRWLWLFIPLVLALAYLGGPKPSSPVYDPTMPVVPADPANLASLKTHALVICLWASPETIWERVRGHNHRPLLNEADPPAKIRELLAARDGHYRQADVLVNTEMRSAREVAQHVVHQFHMAQAAHR